jgi:hypothetical protein
MITKDDSMAMLRFMLSFVTSLQDECRTYHAMRRHVLIDGMLSFVTSLQDEYKNIACDAPCGLMQQSAICAPQTKIWEVRTNIWERMFEVLSKGECSIWATFL